MLSKVTRVCLVAACLWAIADACWGLEHSWFLYLHRALAPLSFMLFLAVGVVAFCFESLRRKDIVLVWFLMLVACGAPILRSILCSSPTATVAEARAPSLRVLNFNILGHTDRSQQIVDEIARHQPDIVTLQEVNHELAHALQKSLLKTYPCQQLDPAPGSWGMGILAKELCSAVTFPTNDAWVGRPQLVQVERPGKLPVLVMNIHAVHPHVYFSPVPCCGRVEGITDTVRARETSIENLLKTSRNLKSSSVILAGDLNSTMRNTVYEIIRSTGMGDSWLELHGFTSGATWPGREFTGTKLLEWLLRIDFVFHCAALRPVRATLLPANLGSDHRGLLVEFSERPA